MKRNRLFLSVTLGTLFIMLLFVPILAFLSAIAIGEDVLYLLYYHYPSPMIQAIGNITLNGPIFLLAPLFVIGGLLILLISLIFLILSGKFPKLVIPAYIFSGLSTVIIAPLFGLTLLMQAGGHLFDGVCNFVLIGTPLKYGDSPYHYLYYGESFGLLTMRNGYVYQSLAASIVRGILHTLTFFVYVASTAIIVVPFIFFLVSIIVGIVGAIKAKRKAKEAEPDVEIPLVKPIKEEPLINH